MHRVLVSCKVQAGNTSYRNLVDKSRHGVSGCSTVPRHIIARQMPGWDSFHADMFSMNLALPLNALQRGLELLSVGEELPNRCSIGRDAKR